MVQPRQLGTNGPRVSALGFGAGHLASPEVSEKDAERLLHGVLDLGITLIDTARGYGLSEERIGRHLAHRRSEFVLVTKCGYGVPGVPAWTARCVTEGIDAALVQLRTDMIDVMLFHSQVQKRLVDLPEREAIVEALERAVEAGKIRVAGYSGDNEDLDYAIGLGRLQAFETSVNICDQRALTRSLPRAAAQGAGVIAKRPLANAPWRFRERPVGDYAETYWERLRTMGLDCGALAWDELALRFTAYSKNVTTAIVGTKSLEHLARNASIVEAGPLPASVEEEIRSAFEKHGADWSGQV